MPIPTAAVFAGAAPAVCAGTLVEAGILVVRTTVPEVTTTTLPDADAKDEATEFKIWLADAVL